MDFSISNDLAGQLALPGIARQARAVTAASLPQAEPAANDRFLPTLVPDRYRPGGTQLLSESREELASGYRLTRTFEKDDGRQFTKVEDMVLTDRGSRRSVVQQNPSGSVTRYEEVLDREDGGSFRRTQRFQDAGCDVSTTITHGYAVSDPFILTGGRNADTFAPPSAPFPQPRGTQLDLRA